MLKFHAKKFNKVFVIISLIDFLKYWIFIIIIITLMYI